MLEFVIGGIYTLGVLVAGFYLGMRFCLMTTVKVSGKPPKLPLMPEPPKPDGGPVKPMPGGGPVKAVNDGEKDYESRRSFRDRVKNIVS